MFNLKENADMAFGVDSELSLMFQKYFHQTKLTNNYRASLFFADEKNYEWIKNLQEKEILIQKKDVFASFVKANDKSRLSELQIKELSSLGKRLIVSSDPEPILRAIGAEYRPDRNKYKILRISQEDTKSTEFLNLSGEWFFNRFGGAGENGNIIDFVMLEMPSIGYKDAIKLCFDTLNIKNPLEEAIEILKNSSDAQKQQEMEKTNERINKLIEQNKQIHGELNRREKIEYETLDTSRDFKYINTEDYEKRYHELTEVQRLQVVYGAIKNFCQQESISKKPVEKYFNSRGLYDCSLFHNDDVGFLPKDKIEELEVVLHTKFGKDDLVKFGIFTEKYHKWKYKVQTKDEKWEHSDAILFCMHSPYSNIPTNLEFRFIGDNAQGAKLKSVSLERHDIIKPNYFGNGVNVDVLKDNNIKNIWFQEGAFDQKTVESLGFYSCSLIGVHKHYSENIGYFKDKVLVIAFDPDSAGYSGAIKFARKCYEAGCKKVFMAVWNSDSDVNELLRKKELDKIFCVAVEFYGEENDSVALSLKKLPLPSNLTNELYEKNQKYIDNLIVRVDSSVSPQQDTELGVQLTPDEFSRMVSHIKGNDEAVADKVVEKPNIVGNQLSALLGTIQAP